MIPKDPSMLLSYVNLKLRDYYSSLEAMCEDLDVEQEDLCTRLQTIGYYYNQEKNQFDTKVS